MLRYLPFVALFALLACSSSDETTPAPNDPSKDAGPTTNTGSSGGTSGGTSSGGTSGGTDNDAGTQPTDAGTDAPVTPPVVPPKTGFCADQVTTLGHQMLFCADFDDPRALGGWKDATYTETAFEKLSTGAGTVGIDDKILKIDAPAGSTAGYRVTIPFTKVQQGHISFDVTMTGNGRFLGLDGLIHADLSTPGKFVAHDATDHPYVGGGFVFSGTEATRIDIDLNPTNGKYSPVPLINGKHLKNDTTNNTIEYGPGNTLTIDFGALVADGGDANVAIDNILVTNIKLGQ